MVPVWFRFIRVRDFFRFDQVIPVNVLFVNPLHKRHGSTYRARNLVRLLALNNRASYVEPGWRKGAGCRALVNERDGALGWLQSGFEYLLVCLRMGFDVLYLQKAMIMAFPCLILAKLKGKHVVIDFDDLDSGWQASGWKKGLMLLGERLMPKYADVITTHNRYLKAHLEGICAKPIFLIPQGVDSGLFDPQRYSEVSEKRALGLGGKKVFCFLGSFTKGSAADLDIILGAFKVVSEQDKDVVLMIIGGEGPLEPYYQKEIKALGLNDRVIITGRKDQRDIPRYLRGADYGLICMRDNLANRYRMSLKLLEYLSMDLTVIGHVVGGSKDAFAPYCFLCDPTADALSERILEVVSGDLKKKSARDFIVENYDWNRFVPLIDEAIKQCKIRHN